MSIKKLHKQLLTNNFTGKTIVECMTCWPNMAMQMKAVCSVFGMNTGFL